MRLLVCQGDRYTTMRVRGAKKRPLPLACGSVEELLALARENKVPLPDGALEAIAGGDQPDPENCKPQKIKCPNCGSTNVTVSTFPTEFECNDCGYFWI